MQAANVASMVARVSKRHVMSRLGAEAKGNMPVADLHNHAGATMLMARAASSEKAFLQNDAALSVRSTRERAKPVFFEAGAT